MRHARTCLVTGASGFIGTKLCAALSPRVHVRALVRRAASGPWAEQVVCDVADGVPASAAAGADTVFHLAARTHATGERGGGDDELYRRINVDGTRAVLESAHSCGVRRFVFVSSVKAMGERADAVLDESSPPRPTTAYGRTKLEAERLVLEGGFVPEPVVLRPALVYGPGVKGNLLDMIAAVEARRFPPPPRVGNRRSMVHVDDVVTATLRAAEAAGAAGRAFIVTDLRAYSTREIYDGICRAFGRSAPAWAVPAAAFRALAIAGDVVGRATGRRWRFDSEAYEKLFGSAQYDGSAAASALGFEPRWSLETALPDIVATFRAQ